MEGKEDRDASCPLLPFPFHPHPFGKERRGQGQGRERKERKPCSLSRGKIRDKGSKIVLGNIVLLFRFFKERKKERKPPAH
jgi:hypothetical protein